MLNHLVKAGKGKRGPLALVLLLAIGMVGLPSGPACASQCVAADDGFEQSVALDSELLAGFRYVPKKIHLVADVLISVEYPAVPAEGWSTAARYEFWRDGERFRASSTRNNPLTPLASDATIAWDGVTLQYWDHSMNLLHLTQGLPGDLALALPNPLLLPAIVLSGDVSGTVHQWLPEGGRLESSDIEPWMASSRDVRVLAPVADPRTISRVEIRAPVSGALMAELDLFDDHEETTSGAGWRFPRTMDLTVYPNEPTAGGAIWRSRFVISLLEVGRDVPPALFDLLNEPIAHIVDESGRSLR